MNSIWYIRMPCRISGIVIFPEYQGNGYAHIMVGMLIDILIESGCKSVQLFVVEINIPAIKHIINRKEV